MLKLIHPLNNQSVSLQTDEQRKFLNDESGRASIDASSMFKSFKWYDLKMQGVDRSAPAPVNFSWEIIITDDINPNYNNGHYFLLVSERKDLKDALVFVTDELFYSVYNLKIGTTYYWCVQKSGKRSEVFSFTTLLETPRTLKIAGVSNFRDMGGYKVLGGIVQQGLVYRGGEMERHINLDFDGVTELQKLKIKTDLDMRAEAEGYVEHTTAETLGIKRIFAPSLPYAQIFDKSKSKALKKFFKAFTNRKNYPIYFHCWGGADRTGTFAFILGAFLGLDYKTLIDDYEYTSLSVWGVRTRNYCDVVDFLSKFNALKGNTPKEKSETFLKEYALLSDKDLKSIYDIMVKKF